MRIYKVDQQIWHSQRTKKTSGKNAILKVGVELNAYDDEVVFLHVLVYIIEDIYSYGSYTVQTHRHFSNMTTTNTGKMICYANLCTLLMGAVPSQWPLVPMMRCGSTTRCNVFKDTSSNVAGV